jgi:hypothetical protein
VEVIHELKLVQPYYDEVVSGVKSFVVRKDDRGFQLGDVLRLKEWDPQTQTYTGRSIGALVNYRQEITDTPGWPEQFLQEPRWVVLGIKVK